MVIGMTSGGDKRRASRFGKRRVFLLLTLLITLLAWPGSAHAQATCDASAVDQYVECVPTNTGDDASAGTGDKPRQTPLPPAVATQVQNQGGSDAPLLQTLATDSRFGAPQKKLKGSAGVNGKTRIDKEQLIKASPQADVSAGEALSAAVSAVQGGDAARLIGLLVALLLVSVATLSAAAVRQKRRSPA